MAAAVLSRATPAASMNSSQAQTSAPVFEYRCMFTHDIRKKAKKWHDGSLRFHTFNKRVMVYDDTKNLVGSLHYRSQEEFAEGLELNLDSHVLVQVEDQLGETSTDLTGLLARHQHDGTSQSVRADPPTRATLSRINAANSQIKPKSIKELLAGSQGQIGRARLPNKSPYEQKHPLIESQPTYPDPKRRKVDDGKENRIENTTGTRQVTEHTMKTVGALPVQDDVVVDVSSEDDSRPPPPTRQRKPDLHSISKPKETSLSRQTVPKLSKKKTPSAVSTSRSRRKSDVPDDSESPSPPLPIVSQRTIKTKQKASNKTTNGHPVNRQTAPSPTSRTPIAETYTPPIRYSSGPRSSLKFAAGKPRPKLMYRALLENSSRPASSEHNGTATRESTCGEASEGDHGREQVRRRPKLTNLIEADNMFAPSQIKREADAPTGEGFDNDVSPSSSPNRTPAASQDVRAVPDQEQNQRTFSPFDDDITETIPDSPLFLPRTTSQVSPSQSRNIAIDDSHVSLLSQALQDTTPKAPKRSMDARTESPVVACDPLRSSHGPISSPVFHRLRSVDEELEQATEVQMSPSSSDSFAPSRLELSGGNREALPPPPRVLPAQVRLFRRVVSENVPPTHTSPDAASVNDSSAEDILNDMLEDSPLDQTSPRVRNLPTQPQSFSDPVDMHPRSPTPRSTSSPPNIDENPPSSPMDDVPDVPAIAPDPPTTAHIPVEESGPWTSTEAFLLFDRWPPGRQKPPYATVTSVAMPAPGIGEDGSAGGGANRNQQSRATSMMSRKKYGTFGSAKFVSQR